MSGFSAIGECFICVLFLAGNVFECYNTPFPHCIGLGVGATKFVSKIQNSLENLYFNYQQRVYLPTKIIKILNFPPYIIYKNCLGSSSLSLRVLLSCSFELDGLFMRKILLIR